MIKGLDFSVIFDILKYADMDDFEINPAYEQIIKNLSDSKYSIADSFFSSDEISALRDSLERKYADNAFKKSAIGNQSNTKIIDTVRGDLILWLDEAETTDAERLFFDKIADFVTYLNRTCYMGIREKEFHYAVYPEGTFYKRHLDTFMNDSKRKLSIVCYLNNEDWKPDYGGELTLYLNKDSLENEVNIYPVQGRMVIFESQVLEHEVKAVKKQRMSVTGWLKSSI